MSFFSCYLFCFVIHNYKCVYWDNKMKNENAWKVRGHVYGFYLWFYEFSIRLLKCTDSVLFFCFFFSFYSDNRSSVPTNCITGLRSRVTVKEPLPRVQEAYILYPELVIIFTQIDHLFNAKMAKFQERLWQNILI